MARPTPGTADELRQLIRELHETIQDARLAKRELVAAKEETRRLIKGVGDSLVRLIGPVRRRPGG